MKKRFRIHIKITAQSKSAEKNIWINPDTNIYAALRSAKNYWNFLLKSHDKGTF